MSKVIRNKDILIIRSLQPWLIVYSAKILLVKLEYNWIVDCL